MNKFSAGYLEKIGRDIFMAGGTPSAEAALVARELVEANLMGLDSHGVIRYPEYAGYIKKGKIIPGAPVRIIEETETTAIVDCGMNFGQVGATRAVEIAIKKAGRNHVSCVIARRCNHVGRLGSYPQKAAEKNMLCIAACNWPISGHYVAPWGGRKGRLATNPIAYAVPTKGNPLVADISTSVLPEGKIRLYLNRGKLLPANTVLDAKGRVTRDPKRFYGGSKFSLPPQGAILPFGGEVGYKGFAIALLVEILSGTLAGNLITDKSLFGNGLCFIVIDPSVFVKISHFKFLMQKLSVHMKSTPLAEGFHEIFLPGEIEFRNMKKLKRKGITLDDKTWSQIEATAKCLGVKVE